MTPFPETLSPLPGYSVNPHILLLSLSTLVPFQKEFFCSYLHHPRKLRPSLRSHQQTPKRAVPTVPLLLTLHTPSVNTVLLPCLLIFCKSVEFLLSWTLNDFLISYLKELISPNFSKSPTDSFSPPGHLIFLITPYQHTSDLILSSQPSIFLHLTDCQVLVRMWGTETHRVLVRV